MQNNIAAPTPYKPKSQRESDIVCLLGSQYQFIRHLGDGAYSTVFAVLNKPLERVEALKVLSDNLTQQEDFLDRFKVEAKISASLTHPNIVTLYEYKKLENFYYFTMHYVDGPPLTKFISPSTPMPIHTICTNIATICKTIDYAHNQGVIHRDLKASNIMLDKSGKPYITDFGIAKWEKALSQTQSGMILGSPHYVSPEQAAGQEIDARTDIYSLGVTLYVLLTQKYPFRGDTPHLTIAQRLTSTPIPPETIKPNLPYRLIEILNKSLQKNPRDRYQSATEMADDLTDFVISEERSADGRATVALPPNGSGTPAFPKKWLITAVACIALALAAPILYSLSRDNSESNIQRHPVPTHQQVPSEAKKENLFDNNPSMNQTGEKKQFQELKLLITAAEQHHLDGNLKACIDAALAAKSIINKLPAHQQARYAEFNNKAEKYRLQASHSIAKKKAESYQLQATKSMQRETQEKQNNQAGVPLITKPMIAIPPELPPRPSGQKVITGGNTKSPQYLKPEKDDSKPAHQYQQQYLDKMVAKIDGQFKDSDFEACLHSANSMISIIDSYDKAQQKKYAGVKDRVIQYREKAARAKNIRDQQRSITQALKSKVAKGEFENAIIMVDAMLAENDLAPEVKEVLLQHRKSLTMLVKKKP
jgi:serine/threonine protein kinase